MVMDAKEEMENRRLSFSDLLNRREFITQIEDDSSEISIMSGWNTDDISP